ncbi:hypothetical protein K402DRAFT_423183 [Aulographum hederae CBS 113979]|uniref:Uncharacterized protein n=1 Tax=Aulographum hederae CBS 113979 TaxID=1176131 RepID=A0A6G1GT11_9PEZI|nr:hypothetical protein K402DRAFT_423183 [Aulographum hederae CBS 113979]
MDLPSEDEEELEILNSDEQFEYRKARLLDRLALNNYLSRIERGHHLDIDELTRKLERVAALEKLEVLDEARRRSGGGSAPCDCVGGRLLRAFKTGVLTVVLVIGVVGMVVVTIDVVRG